MRPLTAWFRRGAAPLLAALTLLAPTSPIAGAASPTSDSGVVCTTNASNAFTVTARDGYAAMPDGNTIYMWSFASGNGAFQMPGPVLCVNQGATVTVALNNQLKEDVSLIFPGQDGVLAAGAPSQPVFSGSELTSLAPVAARNGGSMTYTFVATEPGTYLYESGTDQSKQVSMGLYGGIIVRPNGHPSWAYNWTGSAFDPSWEFMILLAEVDPTQHQNIERGLPFDAQAYHPRYWLINGRSFPDTIAPNGAAWLPAQPYGSLIHQFAKSANHPLPSLVRYLNAGSLTHPFHPHGNSGRIVGRDGRPLQGGNGQDLSFEKYLVDVGAGQTWDATYDFTDIEHFTVSNPPPGVILPQEQNLTYKGGSTFYSGSPYLGSKGPFPTGTSTFNRCGEFYQAWHSHSLVEAANWDLGFGGMFTLWRVDPPAGCS